MKTNVRVLTIAGTEELIIAKLEKLVHISDEAHGGYPYTLHVFEAINGTKYMNFNGGSFVKEYRYDPSWVIDWIEFVDKKGGEKFRKWQRRLKEMNFEDLSF